MMSGQKIADLVLYFFMAKFNVYYTPKSVDFYCICGAFMHAYGSILLNIFEDRETYFADFGEDPDLHFRNIITMHVSLKKILSSMPQLNLFRIHDQPRILIRTCSIMAMSVFYFRIAGVSDATDKGFLYIASAADQCISRSISLRNQPLVTFSSDYYERNPAPHCPPTPAPFYPPFRPIFIPQMHMYMHMQLPIQMPIQMPMPMPIQMPMPMPIQMPMPPVIEPTPDIVLELPPIPEGAGHMTVPVATPSGSSGGRRGRKVETRKVLYYHKTL